PQQYSGGFLVTVNEKITKDNWFKTQNNLRSFTCNSDFILQTRIIYKANTRVQELPYSQAQLNINEIEVEHENGETEQVSNMLKRTETDAFIVLHKGEIVSEHYFNEYKTSQPH